MLGVKKVEGSLLSQRVELLRSQDWVLLFLTFAGGFLGEKSVDQL